MAWPMASRVDIGKLLCDVKGKKKSKEYAKV